MPKSRKFGSGPRKTGPPKSSGASSQGGQAVAPSQPQDPSVPVDRPQAIDTPQATGKPKPPVPRSGSSSRRSLRIELLWVLPALLLGLLVYVNTLNGSFVYDDLRQIVRNTLIQDGDQFWNALTSDVWAFKGGDQAVSNYWRPSFVLWMILNFRLFGLDAFGWHVTNILLHLAVILMVFALMRRLDLSRSVAGAIALIFAVHPVHTESVAWISGSPDLILCLALLGSMWFVLSLGERRTPLRWTLALGLGLVALGAKEIAILYPVIVVALLWRRKTETREKGLPLPKALSIAWPFAATGVVYLIVRQSLLGRVAQWPEGAAGLVGTILSAPAVFAFYLRQLIFPYWIGPSYPLRAVTLENIGAGNFLIPLAVGALVIGWMAWMATRAKIARIGLALFLVPLIPAMVIAAFHPEQLVHDRYLYLPLLGFLILTIPVLASLLERAWRGAKTSEFWPAYVVALVICVPLFMQTVSYNRAWLSNLVLWEWGIRSDPNSAFNYQQYGVYLHEAERLDDAMDALNRSIEINPQANAYLARALTEIDRKEFGEAERDLREITSKRIEEVSPYTMYQAYQALAVSLTQQQKLLDAANTIDEARKRLPQYTAALTDKLAIILYQGGEKQTALRQLVAARAQARTETLPESRLVLYRLGVLNAEIGQTADARAAYEEFLTLTQGLETPEISQARTDAEAKLRDLPR